jgi:hypothetical protein
MQSGYGASKVRCNLELVSPTEHARIVLGEDESQKLRATGRVDARHQESSESVRQLEDKLQWPADGDVPDPLGRINRRVSRHETQFVLVLGSPVGSAEDLGHVP